MKGKGIILTLLLISNCLCASTWYDGKLEGWYYFQEKGQTKKQELTKEEAHEILEEERSSLQQLLSLAVLSPTPTNVENYLQAQKKWIDQSAQFAQTWHHVLLTNPLLGDFLTNPTTSFGIQARKDLETLKRKQLLSHLSKTHFLLFIFRGNDPYSSKAAEVVQLFASMNNWKVKAVSLDGIPLEVFPECDLDKGISQVIGVQATPSMFVIDPESTQVVPVGAGLVSVSELETNIGIHFQDVP